MANVISVKTIQLLNRFGCSDIKVHIDMDAGNRVVVIEQDNDRIFLPLEERETFNDVTFDLACEVAKHAE